MAGPGETMEKTNGPALPNKVSETKRVYQSGDFPTLTGVP